MFDFSEIPGLIGRLGLHLQLNRSRDRSNVNKEFGSIMPKERNPPIYFFVKSLSSGRMVMTDFLEYCATFSDVDARTRCAQPLCPWVAITIRSASSATD